MKEKFPFLLIVSGVNSPTYQLAKYLGKILSNITSNTIYNVKKSTEFIKKFTIPKNHILASLDVQSFLH